MTREILREADPALAKALDSFEPPQLPPSFTDRVVAAAQARSGAELPRMRRRTGPWVRGRRAALGSAALLIVGATAAAATGLLERVGVDLKRVERMVERVAEAVPGLGTAGGSLPAERVAAVAADPVEQPEPATEALTDPRREQLAQGIAARIDRRIARAEARGIEVPEHLRDTDRRLSPERAAAQPERAALTARVQQIREERRRGGSENSDIDATTDPATGEAKLAQIAAGWAGLSWRERTLLVRRLDRRERQRLFSILTPEQRAELLQMRRQRAATATGTPDF